MISKSLKEAMAEAELAAPATTGSSVWDAEDNVKLTVVASNVNTKVATPKIGLQLQREDNDRRRWFDLYFDEENAQSYKRTGQRLRALGCGDLINSLDTTYPVRSEDPAEVQEANATSQLEAIASALNGVVFTGKIDKVERNNTKNLPDDQKAYTNYFQVLTLIEGPASSAPAAPASSFSGFGGASVMGE